MFKFIKRFFGLDYNDNQAERPIVHTRPPVEDKGTIDIPVLNPTRPDVIDDKGTLPVVKKAAPKKKPVKRTKK